MRNCDRAMLRGAPLVGLLLLAALPARAAEPQSEGDAASMRGDCICRAFGRAYEMGTLVCLSTPQGPRLAQCGMVLNNTAWRFSEEPCTVSRAPGGAGGLSLAAR